MTTKITLTTEEEIEVENTWDTIDDNGNVQAYAKDGDGNEYKVVSREIDGPRWKAL